MFVIFVLQPSVLPDTPRRIISLVPSLTELLFDLGLGERVVGITKFCVHPIAWSRVKTIIGGTKNIRLEEVKKLQPDLIIANKEENTEAQVRELMKSFPVLVTDVYDLHSSLETIREIGALTGSSPAAAGLCARIEREFAGLTPLHPPIPTAYLIWKDPWMTVGSDTFIHDMLLRIGCKNQFSDQARYPVTDLETIRSSGLELLLLSSEPYPFSEKHLPELATDLPGIKIQLVNGEFFSWYGSRMLKAPDYFQQLMSSIR